MNKSRIGYTFAALGLIAVLFCALEWIRDRHERSRAAVPAAVPPSDAARAAEGDVA